jgi:lysozyme
MATKLSADGAALIKSFESCAEKDGTVFKPYVCPGGVLTIGWGHTNDHGRAFDKTARWTQRDCDDAFDEDMAFFEEQVTSLVKVPLKQPPVRRSRVFRLQLWCGQPARIYSAAQVERW